MNYETMIIERAESTNPIGKKHYAREIEIGKSIERFKRATKNLVNGIFEKDEIIRILESEDKANESEWEIF